MNEGCEKCCNIDREVEPLTRGETFYGGKHDTAIFKAQLWMVDEGDGIGPCLNLWTANSSNDTLTDEHIQISFCPFCGRRLRE